MQATAKARAAKDAGTTDRLEIGAPGSKLRLDIMALVQEDPDLTQERVASEAGISATALSLWINNRYASDPTSLERKLRTWLDARSDRAKVEALAPVAPRFYESQTARELMDALRYAQSLEDIVTLMGVPGIGKSTVCEEYQRRSPNVWLASLASHTTGVVPVLKRLAKAVGAGGGTGASGLAESIAERITGRRGLLIVDEVHHASLQSLDAIRALHDDTGTAIALVGSIDLAVKIERMPQLRSRLGIRLFRRGVLKSDVTALLDAWDVTDRAQRRYLTEIAERPGALRSVTKTLRLASVMAAGASQAVTIDHLEAAGSTLTARSTREDDHA